MGQLYDTIKTAQIRRQKCTRPRPHDLTVLLSINYNFMVNFFSAIAETLLKTTFLQTDYFIEYIQRNFYSTGNACLKSVSAIAEKKYGY